METAKAVDTIIEKLEGIVTDMNEIKTQQAVTHVVIKNIEKQAIATNGRVASNIKYIEFNRLKLVDLEKKQIACNMDEVKKDVAKLKDETTQARYMQKFPSQFKMYIIGLAVFVIGSLVTFYKLFK